MKVGIVIFFLLLLLFKTQKKKKKNQNKTKNKQKKVEVGLHWWKLAICLVAIMGPLELSNLCGDMGETSI
jgi:heme/copper-type cytochrome/quinol oxidase subunit 2